MVEDDEIWRCIAFVFIFVEREREEAFVMDSLELGTKITETAVTLQFNKANTTVKS